MKRSAFALVLLLSVPSLIFADDIDDAFSAHTRGAAAMNKGDYDKAIACFSLSIELCPDHSLWYYERGRAYYAKKEYEKAVGDCTRAINVIPVLRLDVHPYAAKIHCIRGLAHSAMKEYDEAVKDFTAATGYDRENESANVGLRTAVAEKTVNENAVRLGQLIGRPDVEKERAATVSARARMV